MVYPYLNIFASGMGVNLRTLSFAVSLRSGLGVAAPFLGFLADKRGRKFGMLFGLLMFTVGVGVMVIFPTFIAFVVMLIFTLLGNLLFIPSMQAYLGDRVPYDRRGRSLAITELSWSLSFIIGVPLIGLIIARAGWQSPFLFLTALGVFAMLTLSILLKKRGSSSGEANTTGHNLRLVFLSSPAVAGLFMGAGMSLANELVNITFGVWMEDTFNVRIAALAITSLVIGLSELVGEGIVGVFADRMGKVRAVSIGLFLNIVAAILIPLIGRNLVGSVVGLSIFYLTFEFTLVSSIPLMTEVLPNARATLMASYIASVSGGRALGALIAPPLYATNQSFGIFVIVLFAVIFNLASYSALRHVRTSPNLIRREETP